MTDMEEIVADIKKKQDIIAGEKAIAEIPNLATQRMRLGNVKRAKEDLKMLYYDYRNQIKSSCAFILAVGSQSDKYAKTATSKFDCFSVRADDFYEDISKQVPSPLWKGKTASPSLFDHWAAKFQDRALDIDIIGHLALRFESKYMKALKTEKDYLDLMKLAFNEKIGSEVVGLDAIDKITQEAVNSDFAGKVVPIVLHTKDQSLVLDLAKSLTSITRNVFIVSTGQKLEGGLKNRSIASMRTVSDKTVQDSLMNIKERLV